jgi:hypothetical protein
VAVSQVRNPEEAMKAPWYEDRAFLASAMIVIGLLLASWLYLASKTLPAEIIEQHVPIAHIGDWVTHPDGQKVCRLRVDLFYGQVMEVGDCEDWVEKTPFRGQIVDWLRGPPRQINVNGEWKP